MLENAQTGWAEMDEAQLVLRAQQRDEAAFAELMRRTSSTSLRLALSVLKNRQEAEDQVQNSYLNAWRHLGSFQQDSKFSTWFRTIIMNQCLMRLRKLRRATVVSMDEPQEDGPKFDVADGTASPEVQLRESELGDIIHREIRRLPPLLREVILLRDVDELSTEETAGKLGISVPAAKSRLMRARAMLREQMERHGIRRGGVTTDDLPATV